MTETKWVYFFNELDQAMNYVNNDWDGVRGLFGGKGANLADMSRIGLPVPPGFTVTTEACNAYLAGEDPYEGLRAVRDRVVHVHAKDISIRHADSERGKVTGTPVGCACGDGVIDWSRIAGIMGEIGFDGVFSVECGTPDEAERSLAHLKSVLGN